MFSRARVIGYSIRSAAGGRGGRLLSTRTKDWLSGRTPASLTDAACGLSWGLFVLDLIVH